MPAEVCQTTIGRTLRLSATCTIVFIISINGLRELRILRLEDLQGVLVKSLPSALILSHSECIGDDVGIEIYVHANCMSVRTLR